MLINTKMDWRRGEKKPAFKDPGINNVTQSPFLLTKTILTNSTFLQSKLLKV